MKSIYLLAILILTASFQPAEREIVQFRSLYEQAAKSKKASLALSKLLKDTDENSAALYIGYKGAAKMMQAKYAFNPIHKYKNFKDGRWLIEEAVKKDSKNTEIRYLRYTIQTNLPSFLGYRQNIDEDKRFLIEQMTSITDLKLKHNIGQYLKHTAQYAGAEKEDPSYE